MNIDSLVSSKVQTAGATPSALAISRATVRTVRTGIQAGTRPYIGVVLTSNCIGTVKG